MQELVNVKLVSTVSFFSDSYHKLMLLESLNIPLIGRLYRQDFKTTHIAQEVV